MEGFTGFLKGRECCAFMLPDIITCIKQHLCGIKGSLFQPLSFVSDQHKGSLCT